LSCPELDLKEHETEYVIANCQFFTTFQSQLVHQESIDQGAMFAQVVLNHVESVLISDFTVAWGDLRVFQLERVACSRTYEINFAFHFVMGFLRGSHVSNQGSPKAWRQRFGFCGRSVPFNLCVNRFSFTVGEQESESSEPYVDFFPTFQFDYIDGLSLT